MTQLNRRNFLKKTAVLGAATMTGIIWSNCSKDQPILERDWHLNAAFRIAPTSDNAIELFCNDGKGNKIFHEFSGLEADMLLAIHQKKPLNEQITSLADKYKCSKKECRRKIIALLKEQEEAKIIYSGKEMLVYKSEING